MKYLHGEVEKLRLQKQKIIVEQDSGPIESVEDPVPQKTEESSYIWKPTGDTVIFILIVRSCVGTWSSPFVHPWH